MVMIINSYINIYFGKNILITNNSYITTKFIYIYIYIYNMNKKKLNIIIYFFTSTYIL